MCVIMGLMQASLLLLVGITLAEAQWPGWDRWSQDFNRLKSNNFLSIPQAPAVFHPRAFSHKPAVSSVQTAVQDPVQTPVQDPVQVPGEDPVQMPDQDHMHSPVQSLNSPVWNLVKTSVPASIKSPALTNGINPVQTPVQDPVWSPLPVPAQKPALTSEQDPVQNSLPGSDQGPVPVQNPALTSGPKTAQSAVVTSVNPPVWNLVHTPVPAPDLHPVQKNGLNHVLAPVQDPVENPALTSKLAQSPVQATVQAPGWHPPQAPLSLPHKDPLHTQAQIHEPRKKLSWRFPKVPERPQQSPVDFDLQQPAPANSVAAACGESVVLVEVKQNLFGTGHLVNSSSLTLGGCAAVGQDSEAQVLIFQSELQACGSMLSMTDDDLVYSFNLIYSPEPLPGTPIVRAGGAVVQIECHYSRKHNVSSNALVPSWVPYASTEVAEEHLVFALKLMTDDWKFERPSNQYFLGDFMNIEASLMQFNHVPLNVFVDSCVATADPEDAASPRYSFIENHGCLIDAKITGSNSHFMQRVQGNKLQFQLEVFTFEQDNSSLIYITCFLKGSRASYPTDAEHKACSFTANGWIAADGNNQVCRCCDANCSSRKGRSLPTDEGVYVVEAEVPLGPILVNGDA
ncbi:zona pellucida sperm-binding protein 3-like [Pygocentrus nattereri]|nr:zona pellucida sperm-binding protein 3-like [Pygocentrus nattereri]